MRPLRLGNLAAPMQRDNPADNAGVSTQSQAELAAMMGMARQTSSTLLGRLEARGIISVGFRGVRVQG